MVDDIKLAEGRLEVNSLYPPPRVSMEIIATEGRGPDEEDAIACVPLTIKEAHVLRDWLSALLAEYDAGSKETE